MVKQAPIQTWLFVEKTAAIALEVDSVKIELTEHSALIQKITRAYAARYNIYPYTSEDLNQDVQLLLLERISSIQQSYRGEASLTHYLAVVVRNACREVARRKKLGSTKEKPLQETEVNRWSTSAFASDQQLHFKEEIQRLALILKLYGKQGPRIQLSFKSLFRLQIFRRDIQSYLTTCRALIVIDAYLRLLNESEEANDLVRFGHLTQLFNTAEEKNNSTEATRKWTLRKQKEVVELLNGQQHNRFYSRETLGVLFEWYCEQERKLDLQKNGPSYE